jgi:hypothetical protein
MILAINRIKTGKAIESRSWKNKEKWSGWGDLNSRPLAPQASALAGLRYTPNHKNAHDNHSARSFNNRFKNDSFHGTLHKISAGVPFAIPPAVC